MSNDVNSIEWDAPIVPGLSMAAIPLHAAYDDLDAVIAAYLIDADARLYRFEGGPDLHLERYGPDEHGNGGLLFSLPGGDRAGDMAALSITIGGGVVRALKVYALGMPCDVVARSPIVDLRQDQLAWVVWFLIFLFLPSCISMRRRSGSVAEVITGSSKFPAGVCRSRMSRSRS